jgi:hypothetical protein
MKSGASSENQDELSQARHKDQQLATIGFPKCLQVPSTSKKVETCLQYGTAQQSFCCVSKGGANSRTQCDMKIVFQKWNSFSQGA